MGEQTPRRPRARASGVVLTRDDARIVKGMLLRGDRQHDIAAWFGVNGGRVAEVSTGALFAEIRPALAEELPPPGPYRSGRAASAAMSALAEAKRALAVAESRIRSF
jgi:hypothetical protein